ncbi:MAG: hypothetical protein LLG01_00545 [Planctomycetaceae bacterium]|nr:hypothetical protein [Planctomycetaceae bacterium]
MNILKILLETHGEHRVVSRSFHFVTFVNVAGSAAMPDWGTIAVQCRKCGRVTYRAWDKVGVLFACPQCKRTTQTHGIAGQPQATSEQYSIIVQAARKQFRVMLVAGPAFGVELLMIALFLLGGARAESDNWLSLGATYVWVVAHVALFVSGWILLFAERMAFDCLGYCRTTLYGLFFIGWPIWMIVSIVATFRMQSAVKRLAVAGHRV